MKIEAITTTIKGRETKGVRCILTETDHALVSALKVKFSGTLAYKNGDLFMPFYPLHEVQTAVAAEIAKTTPVRIDISDPRLGESGGGTVDQRVKDILKTGKRIQLAQRYWELYRSGCAAIRDGQDVRRHAGKPMVELLNAGKLPAEIVAWFDADLAVR